ncbi:hypothetical protein ACUTJJ_05185 [Agrobacterium sp. DKPNP3]|uniref:hypothetical protein n=1 Tax=Agrobacterium sp. DKPNP3 TaxID=3457323 RepID=UPI0040441074
MIKSIWPAFENLFGPSKKDRDYEQIIRNQNATSRIHLMLTFATFNSDIISNIAIKADFLNTYTNRPDAQHWHSLAEIVRRYAISPQQKSAFYQNYDDVGAKEYCDFTYAHMSEVKHMLAAFADGQRFIVAKLSYDGGAA